MAVVDAINRKLRATVYTAREAGPAAYAVRRGGHLLPAYTTRWCPMRMDKFAPYTVIHAERQESHVQHEKLST